MANEIKFTVLGDVKDLEKSMASAGKSFATLGKASAVAFAGMTASVFGFIEAAREHEMAVNSLNQALKNQGNFTEQASKDLQDYANSLQSVTLFDNTAIVAAQKMIATFGIEGEQLKQLTKATLDFAQAKGVDLVSASELIAKSVGSSTNALARYGVVIEGSAGSAERVSSALRGLNKLYEGQAEAATAGLGSTIQLKNALGDLAKEIGLALAPTVTELAKSLTKVVEQMQQNPEVAKMAAEFLKFGIVITGTTAGIWLMVSATGTLTTAVTALGGALTLLAANPAIFILGTLATVAGATAYATYDLANAWKKTNEEVSKQIEYQNQMLDYYKLGNTDNELGRITIIKQRAELESSILQEKLRNETRVSEEIEALKSGLQEISAIRTQQEVDDYIIKLNEKRDAEVEFYNIQQQLYSDNNALTQQKLEEFNESRAGINAKYDGLELLAKQSQQEKLSALEMKGADIAKKVNADKVASLSSTLQQAAQLNSKFANAYKAVAIGEAIMSTAAGVTRAFKDYPFPASLAVAALVGAAGAVQIATIASQSFAVGTPEIPKDMTAQVHAGEMIVPATFSDAIRSGELSLSGGESNTNNSSLTIDLSGATFNGITESFVRDIFTRASEAINNRTLSPLPAG